MTWLERKTASRTGLFRGLLERRIKKAHDSQGKEASGK